MSRLATRRLIDASATLDAADRALLNIWLKRGLDDAALARMTGMSEETITHRRFRIVEQLSVALGLPPDDLRSALDDIAASPEIRPVATGDALVVNGAAHDLVPPAATGPSTPPADTESSTPPSSRRRRPLWSALALLSIVAAVVVVVVLTSGGSGPDRRQPATSVAASTESVPSTSATSTQSGPAPRRVTSAPLVPLPGGAAHATGTVTIARSGQTLTLSLSVRDLPTAASGGHYEVWLYNSLTYSEALGRLGNGVTHVSLRLPGNAGGYHSIDISFQPTGHLFNSGESMLRATNPAFGTHPPASS